MIRIHVRRQPFTTQMPTGSLPAKNQQLLSFSIIGLCFVKLSHCNTIFSESPRSVLTLEEASLVEHDFGS
jgi:hypothetical protein